MTELRLVRSIPELKVVILKKWEDGDSLANRTRFARLELGRLLVELRDRVESGEEGDQAAIDWWGWYGDNFLRPRSEAEKAMALAREADRTGDPAGTVARHRARKANDEAARRAKQKAEQKQGTTPRGADTSTNFLTSPAAAEPEDEPPEPPRYTEPPEPPRVPKAKPKKLSAEEQAKYNRCIEAFVEMEWPTRKLAVQRIAALYREWHGAS